MTSYRIGPETARLVLRAMTVEDAVAFHALNSHPEVMRYTGEPPMGSVEEARRAIAEYPDFDTVGFGRWAAVLKESGAMIGFCGLKHLADLDEVDIGFRFLPEYWGQGLATEAALATLGFGLSTIGLARVIGLVLQENGASVRVLEKIGMVADGEIDYEGLRALRYSTGRERFAAGGGASV